MRVIDVGGRTVVPGLNDAHTHEPDVWHPVDLEVAGDDPTLDDIVGAIRREGLARPKGTWLRVSMGLGLPGAARARRHPALAD